MKRNFLLPFLLLAATAMLPACVAPLVYSAKEIHGQIVDDETGQPLEGVIIVAQWELMQMGFGDSGHKGNMVNIIEVVTDNAGNYSIPSWGPRPRLPFNYLDDDPSLSIFKSGYTPTGLQNVFDSNKSLRISDWDGKVIRLKKFEGGSLEDFAFLLSSLRGGLADDGRRWRSFPRMVLALDAEIRHLRTLGLKLGYGFNILDTEKLNKSDLEFLKRYEK